MDFDLPPYEDIYDFNEQELNHYKSKITQALQSPSELSEKWQRKANKIIELIQIELDERITVNQIASFCMKELNSELYQEIVSEELTQPSTETRESEASVSEKMWNTRKTKKNYKDFVKNTLKNTQQSTGLRIGGSSVPVVPKTNKVQEQKLPEKPPEKPFEKPQVRRDSKPVEAKKPVSKKPDNIEKLLPPKPNKIQDKGKVPDKKPLEKTVTKQNDDRNRERKINQPKQESKRRNLSQTREPEIKEVNAGIKNLENKKEVQKDNLKVQEKASDIENKTLSLSKEVSLASQIKEEAKNIIDSEGSKVSEIERDIKMSKIGENEKIITNYKEIQQYEKKGNQNSTNADKSAITLTELKDNEPKNLEVELKEKNTKNQPYISTKNKEIETTSYAKGIINEEKVMNLTDSSNNILHNSEKNIIGKVANLECKEISDIKNKIIINENIEENKAKEKIGNKNNEIRTLNNSEHLENEAARLRLEAEKLENNDNEGYESEECSENVEKKKNSSSTINDLSLSEKSEERYIRKTQPISETYQPDYDAISNLRALKEKIKQQAKPTQEKLAQNSNEPLVSIGAPADSQEESIPKEKSISSKETKNQSITEIKTSVEITPSKKPTMQKKKSDSKIQTRTLVKPKPKAMSSDEITDYSPYYETFFDIFSGNKIAKEFNPLIALREVFSMFKEFVDLIDSPEFEIQRKFKLTLAPLEINPIDLVKGHEFTNVLPGEREMYYRVVKARPEVYDIVSRGFNKKRGWSELPHGMNLRLSWNVMWTWSKPSVDFSKLLVWQQVNHFPETKNFSRKDMLKKNIEKIMKTSSKASQLWNIIPLTYVLPKEYLQFVDSYAKQEETNPETNVWIMKPVGKSRGRGISVVNDVNQVSYGEIMIIQKYISNPLLLEGFKFDLRLYILITSFLPLEAFIYKEGFARISTVPFSMNPDKLHNKFIHLTNSSIQKHNQNVQNDSLDTILGGTKICLKTLKERLGKMGINWEKIWQQIIEVIIKSLIAVQSEIPSYPCCFDLVGYDIMIDQNLQSWLVEINSSPSLARENYLDDLIKQQLIDDTLDLINPLYFNKIELLKVLERRTSEVQRGHINNTTSQMNIDLTKILEGKKPRKYGEIPEKIGNFDMIAPSPLYEKYYKINKK